MCDGTTIFCLLVYSFILVKTHRMDFMAFLLKTLLCEIRLKIDFTRKKETQNDMTISVNQVIEGNGFGPKLT